MARRAKFIVGIVGKSGNKLALELALRVVDWLKRKNCDYRIDREFAQTTGIAKLHAKKLLDREDFTRVCDPIVVLGGDGTLISVSRHPAKRSPRILGVNLGTLGFLTEVTVEELFPTLENVLGNRAQLERRYLLSAQVRRGKSKPRELYSINDLVITKGALARIFAVDVFVDHAFAATIRGDGVIVSTPGGSTAYSLSAGGSIVHPQVEALLVTPICPHSLTSRPLVLRASSEVRLRVAEDSREQGDIFFTVDGQEGVKISGSDEIRVTTSKRSVLFVKSPSRNYFQVLGNKLKWANT